MEKIINVAQYIFTEYRRITGEVIDETIIKLFECYGIEEVDVVACKEKL